MGAAEVISFEEVRVRKQWDTLRQQLHERFDHWLDTLEKQWHEAPSTLMEITATGIVKLLGMIVSPGNSRHFPDAIATDPTLRRPAPYR